MDYEMIERVAKEISYARQKIRYGGNVMTVWEQSEMAESYKEEQRVIAIATIKAMREPTEKMLNEGPGEPYMDAYVWSKMIDVVIND